MVNTIQQQTDPDAPIMAAVAAGDRTAFAQLYDRHADLVYSICCSMLRDADAAADATQEVFLRVWSRASDYEADRAQVKTWVTTIAQRHVLDLIRRRRVRLNAGTIATGGTPGDEVAALVAAPDDTEAAAVGAVEGAVVRGALADLPERERELLHLAYFQGFTQREIAERLELPLGTVKTRMFHGLARLREQLGQATGRGGAS